MPREDREQSMACNQYLIAENCCAVRQASDLPATVAVLTRETREEWRKPWSTPTLLDLFLFPMSTPQIIEFIIN